MKSIIFDTGPIISLTTNNMLWLLDPLRRNFGGKFCISKSVKKELVDKPLSSKIFQYEAMQVLELLGKSTLEVVGNDIVLRKTKHLLDLANSCFKAKGNWIQLVHFADMEVLSLALFLNAEVVVFDERTTRLLVEDPVQLKELLEQRLHTEIYVDRMRLEEFRKITKGLQVVRSAELVSVAFELGLFDEFLSSLPDVPHQTLLESALCGTKLAGCSISPQEIQEMLAHARTPEICR